MSRARSIIWMGCSIGLSLLFLLACKGDSQVAPAGEGQTPKAVDFFSSEQIVRGKAYRFENRVVYFISLGIQVATLVVLLTTGAGGTLRDLVSQVGGRRPWLSALLFSVSVLVLLSVVSLPTSLYSGYFHEHAYGLSTQRLSGWFLDYGKSLLVNVAVFAPVGLGLWTLIRRFPETWWLTAWGASGVVSVLLVFLAPILIDPIFHSFKPIRDEEFRRRAVSLAERAGIRVREVLEMDASRRTRHVNAYFTGLGRTKRIVVYDTLLKGSTPAEAELILAHEMGHWKHDHIYKGIGLSFVGSLIVLLVAHRTLGWAASGGRFGLSGADDPLALALILLLVTVLNFLSLPVQNTISRSFERQADMESLLLTDQPDVFIETEKKLAITNLADVEPWWGTYYLFYTHPSVMERIGMALKYKSSPHPSPPIKEVSMKVLLCPEVSPELFEQVKAVSSALNVVMASREAAVKEAEDAEVFFGYHNDAMLKAAKRLKWIQSGSAGMDRYLSPALVNSDVIICNASGLHAPQVAEHAWALTLALFRGIPHYIRNQAGRVWKGARYFDVYGATAGIIGFGGIGKEYAKRAQAFDMRIVAVDAHAKERPAYVEGLWGLERLDDLIRMSDVVFIAVPYTEKTEKLINAGRLAMMKPTAFLVNTARGGIVDEKALIAALRARQIAGAGLDVFEVEPLPKESELWELDNVIITTHSAGGSAFRPRRLIDFFCENLRRYLAGQPLMNVVDKKLGYPVKAV